MNRQKRIQKLLAQQKSEAEICRTLLRAATKSGDCSAVCFLRVKLKIIARKIERTENRLNIQTKGRFRVR